MNRLAATQAYGFTLGLLVVGCISTQPAPPCSIDDDCDDARCVEGRCAPYDCDADADCAADAVCVARTCVDCREDVDCDVGLFCEEGQCLSSGALDCFEDADCPSATICRDRQCLPTCDDGSACPSGECVAGACPGCLEDSDCGDGACVEGSCRHSCEANSDCREEERCIADRCVAPCGVGARTCNLIISRLIGASLEELSPPLPRVALSGCQISGEALVSGLCDGSDLLEKPRICDPCLASLGGCLGACEGGDCLCEDSDDCPAGRVCSAGICAPCQLTEECGCGQFCSYGLCRDGCVDDASCGPGLQCLEGRCSECGGGVSCPEGERCYEDGCVAPCVDGELCSSRGRSSLCDTYEPFEELVTRQCD